MENVYQFNFKFLAFFLLILFLITVGIVKAEEEIDNLNSQELNTEDLVQNDFSLYLNLPESLIGNNVIVKNSDGSLFYETTLDTTGICQLPLNQTDLFQNIVVNADAIESLGNKNSEKIYYFKDLIVVTSIVFLTTFSIAFILGRRSCLKILRQLRDYVYEEDFD